jgi:hypothetical protein
VLLLRPTTDASLTAPLQQQQQQQQHDDVMR